MSELWQRFDRDAHAMQVVDLAWPAGGAPQR
jgi:hypothetical protein